MPTSTIVPKIRLRNARAWAPRSRLRWPAALAVFVAALLARVMFHDYLGPQNPLLFFTVATMVVHFFLGLAPALAVALVSLPTGIYLFVPPYLSFAFAEFDKTDLIRVATFAGYTGLYMLLIQYLRRAQYQSVLLAEIAESRYLMLLDSESDRSAAEAEIERRAA
jgi:K+-sensing histidine kinase KdpD